MSSPSPVQSVDRVLDIIEALSNATHGIGLTDLSEQVGLHVSTTHRLLTCLVLREYVQKDPSSNKYRLSPKLFEIGSRTINGTNLLSIALPHIERLADITGETIHLVVRQGSEVVYLYKEDSNNSVVRIASFVGQHNPMYCTGVGKCIMAFLPPEETQKIWNESTIIRFTPYTITKYSDLLVELEEARRVGYGKDNEEHELGVSCIAAPIFNYSGFPVAALSVSFPSNRVDEERREEFAALLLESARCISTALGASVSKIAGANEGNNK